MPCTHRSRTTQRGALSLPIAVRVLAFGQLARLTPPRAISPNIVECSEATYDAVLKMRSEMAIAGEELAACRAAELRRVIAFGFDETTKFQVGTLSTKVQGETTDGRVVNIVLRGAFVIAGGTAEH
eukprot:3335424-Pleurochrysis_carterae.AAC.1